MMSGATISSPFTESWLAWVMLMLLLLMVVADIFQPGMFTRAFRSLPTTKERDSIFVTSGKDYRSRVLFVSYGLITMGLFLRWVFFTGDGFTFTSCTIATAACTIGLFTRKVSQKAIGYVFFEPHELDTIIRHYRYINDSLMVALYPLLLMALYSDLTRTTIIALACLLAVVYMVLVTYKLVACLPFTPSGFFYLPLYLITVELVPAAGMIYLAQLWLS